MKIRRAIFAGFMLIYGPAFSQLQITVQSGVNVFLYESLDSAIANAISGDQVYVPGGLFTVGTLSIDKGILLFGAGHYPDSSVATGPTKIMGNFNLLSGSSGGLITGCDIAGDIRIGDGTPGSDSVANFTIMNCRMKNLYLSYSGLPPTHAKSFVISDNVISGNIRGGNAQQIYFNKNLIEGSISHFNGNCTFLNNDFIGLGDCASPIFISDVRMCNFQNNIMLFVPPACAGSSFLDTACANNYFGNNIIRHNLSFPLGSNSGSANIVNQPVDSIYTNVSGSVFSYSFNYHLRPGSPGINSGSDGNDIGIYGSLQPYKEGGIPFNPHIQQKSIGTSTDQQGRLNIQVQVEAQDH